MAIMDVFLGDAFSARSLTAAVDRYSYVPNFLETLSGLFTPKPVRTAEVWIEERDFAPVLIQTSPAERLRRSAAASSARRAPS